MGTSRLSFLPSTSALAASLTSSLPTAGHASLASSPPPPRRPPPSPLPCPPPDTPPQQDLLPPPANASSAPDTPPPVSSAPDASPLPPPRRTRLPYPRAGRAQIHHTPVMSSSSADLPPSVALLHVASVHGCSWLRP
ncbi:hypothetical protein U9M48_037230 [Paspalum notatum var. saurae]|uniref:Uncharacterized protein n=1 Tax=Paspalum notatum var. saurae TaxID=547442 RepID=A0AAQ3X925_PASNO